MRASLYGEFDTISERIAWFVFPAQGTMKAIQRTASFDPYPLEEVDIGKHLAAVARCCAARGGAVCRDMATRDQMDYPASADIMEGAVRVLDKGLRSLESLLPLA
ncbi:MAG: hypothetical protein ACK4IU_09565 [Tabrizicola flagellatus]